MRRFINGAFTLIELIVVIAIIILLAGMLMAVFFQARGKAWQTNCASNLHQLSIASLMYAQDYDGRFPPFINVDPGLGCDVADGSDITGTGRLAIGYCAPALLHAALASYVKNRGVWFCPSDPFARQRTDAWLVSHYWSSYAFYFTRNTVLSPDGYLLVNGQRQDPITVVLIRDSRLALEAQIHPQPQDTPYNRLIDTPPGYSHFNGVNQAYADGHIKLYIPGKSRRTY